MQFSLWRLLQCVTVVAVLSGLARAAPGALVAAVVSATLTVALVLFARLLVRSADLTVPLFTFSLFQLIALASLIAAIFFISCFAVALIQIASGLFNG